MNVLGLAEQVTMNQPLSQGEGGKGGRLSHQSSNTTLSRQ
ncbi:hypothetical protein JCM19239_4145 [Vibrio variabilis]|uniref:Uncharacterized protein n=1 Tax=Vibrio variabilis TaxID=990271 RepID=A0ABQ0JNZ4_9VIBR|nr:hypothetical protein JCM19239_4145 [Vibrio variabilis]